jgi:hypothetical protein
MVEHRNVSFELFSRIHTTSYNFALNVPMKSGIMRKLMRKMETQKKMAAHLESPSMTQYSTSVHPSIELIVKTVRSDRKMLSNDIMPNPGL